MADYQVSLPEDLYSALVKAAESSGVTPQDWIAAHLYPECVWKNIRMLQIGDLLIAEVYTYSGHSGKRESHLAVATD